MYTRHVRIDGKDVKRSYIALDPVASLTHPSAQDDVGMIAVRAQIAQTANAQAKGVGELALSETLCPFQLFHGDGVERLGVESAREHVRWVSAIWEILDRSVTVPDWSETQSPTGSMHMIRSMASTSTHSSSAMPGLRSTTFLPPMESIPDLSDFRSLSGSSVGSLSPQPSLRSHAAADAAISNQTIVYLETRGLLLRVAAAHYAYNIHDRPRGGI